MPSLWAGKFTCLASDTELRGVITAMGNQYNQEPSTFDVFPDINYKHLVLPHPAPDTVHIEMYGRDINNPSVCAVQEEPPPFNRAPYVFDRESGTSRPVQKGDNIRLTGFWVTDNHDHGETNQLLYQGVNQVYVVKTELHPYHRKSVRLIYSALPNEFVEQTLTICAPVFKKIFTYTWPGNLAMRLADKFAKTAQVLAESIQKDIDEEWKLVAPPLQGIVDYTHKLVLQQTVKKNSGTIHGPDIVENADRKGFTVRIQAIGDDIRNHSVFQAKFRVKWEPKRIYPLIVFFTSESMRLARYGKYSSQASRDSLDPQVHRNWALSKSFDQVKSELSQRYFLHAQWYANTVAHPTVNFPVFFATQMLYFVHYGLRYNSSVAGYNANSTDIRVHKNLARANQRNNASLLLTELRNRVELLCDFVYANVENYLKIIFTKESVLLATYGGYENDAMNSQDPQVHFHWASARSATTI